MGPSWSCPKRLDHPNYFMSTYSPSASNSLSLLTDNISPPPPPHVMGGESLAVFLLWSLSGDGSRPALLLTSWTRRHNFLCPPRNHDLPTPYVNASHKINSLLCLLFGRGGHKQSVKVDAGPRNSPLPLSAQMGALEGGGVSPATVHRWPIASVNTPPNNCSHATDWEAAAGGSCIGCHQD